MNKVGRPDKISAEHMNMLLDLVRERPLMTWSELEVAFEGKTGVAVHSMTLRRALRRAGVTRQKAEVKVELSGKQREKRYGYTAAHRKKAPEQLYASSLTDSEWELVADLFEATGRRGLPPSHSRRSMLDACCYVVRTGCAWRMLPQGFPHWDNVYKTFRRWSSQGKFEQMHDRLRSQWRQREERDANPTAAVLDAQSTRHSPQGGEHGYDAGKKVKGRKRSLIVDTLGLLLAVCVTSASLQDRDAAQSAVSYARNKYPSVRTLFVDGAYAGQWAIAMQERHGIHVEVVRSPANRNVGRWHTSDQKELFVVETRPDGFIPLAKRWVVERTHAWNERARRLIMHHDRLNTVAEAWVWLTEARMLARRLTT
jgi:transposase